MPVTGVQTRIRVYERKQRQSLWLPVERRCPWHHVGKMAIETTRRSCMQRGSGVAKGYLEEKLNHHPFMRLLINVY